MSRDIFITLKQLIYIVTNLFIKEFQKTTFNHPICWFKSFHISPSFLDTEHKNETIVDEIDQELRTGIDEVFDELQKMGFEKSLIEVAIASTRCLSIEILVEKPFS